MLSGCPELEAQKSTLSQFWYRKKDILCQSWKLWYFISPAAHPQYSQVGKGEQLTIPLAHVLLNTTVLLVDQITVIVNEMCV